ncbi:phenylalanine--tRNA ligase subunit alpha [Chlamydiifrater phoenicopteri]|uniref:phenylalanine--tRNA ligase subunit alpha n=1 Tax=Chlamydiifrater phoenicopteri TaxID=2681469 RepID=UPI001BCB2F9A|nr:phenylalanine--tRNA ligase subunit alpha [Chlamydiifrater phoenicopteri]
MDIKERISSVRDAFFAEIGSAKNSEDLTEIRVKYLGKKGIFRGFSEELKQVSPEERPALGSLINSCKALIEEHLSTVGERLLEEEENKKLLSEKIDITLPGEAYFSGGEHVLKKTLREIVDIFVSLGFSVQEAPNIETEANNFSLLNFSEDHPARQMHDTFYLDEKTLLRTHTSNVQARELKRNQEKKMKVVAPGLCFRNEDVSSRSHVMFHQVEAFFIDERVNMADLVAVLKEVFQRFFRKNVQLKFRHSYFPFVEPGVEVDVSCIECSAKGCSLCKNSGWLEVAGAGMIHPNVLCKGGADPEKLSGYALGMGIERLVMLRHGIPDIRLFFENDVKFLKQF